MLAKNEISDFLYSVETVACGFLGYWLVFEPRYLITDIFSSWQSGLVFVVTLVGLVYAISRWFLADMEDAYGWKGLIRRASYGLLIGLLLGLLYRFQPDNVEGSFLLAPLFQTVLPVLIWGLVFWLIFRRNPFAGPQKTSARNQGPSIANMRWVLLIGGILTVMIGFSFLYFFSSGQTKPILLGTGIVMMGWCGVISGALTHRGRHDGMERRLSGFAGILILAALGALLAGALWR